MLLFLMEEDILCGKKSCSSKHQYLCLFFEVFYFVKYYVVHEKKRNVCGYAANYDQVKWILYIVKIINTFIRKRWTNTEIGKSSSITFTQLTNITV